MPPMPLLRKAKAPPPPLPTASLQQAFEASKAPPTFQPFGMTWPVDMAPAPVPNPSPFVCIMAPPSAQNQQRQQDQQNRRAVESLTPPTPPPPLLAAKSKPFKAPPPPPPLRPTWPVDDAFGPVPNPPLPVQITSPGSQQQHQREHQNHSAAEALAPPWPTSRSVSAEQWPPPSPPASAQPKQQSSATPKVGKAPPPPLPPACCQLTEVALDTPMPKPSQHVPELSPLPHPPQPKVPARETFMWKGIRFDVFLKTAV